MVAQDGSLGSGTLRDALDITRQKGESPSNDIANQQQMTTRYMKR
jgi:hypothetical protein